MHQLHGVWKGVGRDQGRKSQLVHATVDSSRWTGIHHEAETWGLNHRTERRSFSQFRFRRFFFKKPKNFTCRLEEVFSNWQFCFIDKRNHLNMKLSNFGRNRSNTKFRQLREVQKKGSFQLVLIYRHYRYKQIYKSQIMWSVLEQLDFFSQGQNFCR